MKGTYLALLMCYMVVAMPSGLHSEENDLLSRFKREAPFGWAKIASQELGLEFRARLTFLHPRSKYPDKRELHYDLRWNRRPESLVLEVQSEVNSASRHRYVVVYNDHYEFKAVPVSDTSWKLEVFSRKPPQLVGPQHLTGFMLMFQPFMEPLTTVANNRGLRLSQLMEDPSFRLDGATWEGNQARVQFHYSVERVRDSALLCRADVLLDPNANWAINEYRLTVDQKVIHWVTERATTKLDGYAPPVKATWTYYESSAAKTWYLKRTAVYESVKRSTVQPAAFRLSGYGLPEPAGIQVPASPIWPTLLAAAGFCAGIAGLAWWFAKRGNPQPTAGIS